jgi:hypothetical protein
MTLSGVVGSDMRFPTVILLRSLCIVSAFLGAYIGSNKRKKRYRRKK